MESWQKPLKLKTNKISYLIPGGHLIERFLGEEPSAEAPSQMWVASVVQSVLDGAKDSRSYYVFPDGSEGCLAEELSVHPAEYLGEKFAQQYGPTPGFLLKLLNSRDRLLVQTHPDREKAKKYFGSPFGKTESWYVIDTKPGRESYIWAGFRPGVTKETFLNLVRQQDTEEILNCLHQFAIKPEDVIFIPAGLPHALGADSLVAELQEPTDITLRAERFRPDGSELPEESLHSGIGYEGLMDCFAFDCGEKDEIRKRIFLTPECKKEVWGEECVLIGERTTNMFGMDSVCCVKPCTRQNKSFAVALVLGGSGWITYGENEQERILIQKGTELFLPYGMKTYGYEPDGELKVLECYPPEVI